MKQKIITLEILNQYFDIDAVYRSGQTFSIDKISDNEYIVISLNKICRIVKYDIFTKIYVLNDDLDYWNSYFNLEVQFDAYIYTMISSRNKFIKKCAKYSKGLVILKQDLWETMISFIISQRKSIPSIKTSLNRLRDNFGESYNIDINGLLNFKSLPQPKDLLWCGDLCSTLIDLRKGESENAKRLLSCGLGYRCEYLLYAADWYLKTNISNLSILSYTDHMKQLQYVKGIGAKVANCICLFAFNDLSAFPIDVWIERIINKKLLSNYDINYFKPYAGFLQQVIFYYVINHKNEF